MSHFKRIALVANIKLPEIVDTLKRLISFLELGGYAVLLESKTAEIIGNTTLPVFNCQEIELQLDLVIVVGGDGSMLSAGRIMVNHNVPLLGVN